MSASVNSHIFSNHLLPEVSGQAEPNMLIEQVWPSVLLLLCLALLAIIKAGAFSRVLRIVQSTFSNQILQQIEREEVNALKLHSLALSTFYLINISFLLYKLNALFGMVLKQEDSFFQFGFFFLLMFLLFGAKFAMLKLLAFFTDKYRLFADYSTSTLLVNQTLGLFIFPLIALAEFTDANPLVFVWIALGLIAASALLKWYRGLIMSLIEERIGILQIFSYFCGLEILPLLTVAKFVVESL